MKSLDSILKKAGKLSIEAQDYLHNFLEKKKTKKKNQII